MNQPNQPIVTIDAADLVLPNRCAKLRLYGAAHYAAGCVAGTLGPVTGFLGMDKGGRIARLSARHFATADAARKAAIAVCEVADRVRAELGLPAVKQ